MFRIAEIEPIGISVPLSLPVEMSGETVARAENLVVRATDGEGNAGWGEAASAPLMTGETLPGMLAAARFASARLAGTDADSIEGAAARIARSIHGNPGMKCAIEMAVLDLAGRRTGKPLHELLGGRARERADSVRLLAAGDAEAVAEQVRRYSDAGIRAFKVKVAAGGLESDIERCKAARESACACARVSADANQGFSRSEGVRFCAGCAGTGLDFIEQPVAAGDLEGMRACSEASGVPVGADEGFRSIEDIVRHCEAVAASGGGLKPLKFGLAKLMAAGAFMESVGMKINLAGKVAETAIGSAAVAHLAVALPQLDWDVSLTNRYLAMDVAERPYIEADGAVAPNELPGLGIQVDEAALGSLRIL